jgi:uncharacterized surface anchored protein
MSSDTRSVQSEAVRGTPIRGHVRDAAQAAVAGAVLTLVDGAGRQVSRERADQSGAYEVFAPGAGNFVLIASARSHRPQAGTATVGNGPVRFDITLAGASSLGGIVRSASSAVLAGAIVTLADAHGEVRESFVTTEGGAYVFSSLEAETYTLAVTAAGHRPVALAVAVAAGLESRQDVELAASTSISGRIELVVDHGHGIGVKVTLIDAEGSVARVTSPDAEGRYIFHDLGPGSYSVVATGYAPVREHLRVLDGGQVRHDVRLGG